MLLPEIFHLLYTKLGKFIFNNVQSMYATRHHKCYTLQNADSISTFRRGENSEFILMTDDSLF